MTGKLNTKLAWAVGLGMLWAWLGLAVAVLAPEGPPDFELGLKPGDKGIVLEGRLAELVEDEQGVRLTMDFKGPDGEQQPKDQPKLPDGVTVNYIPPAQFPAPPRIEVHSGFGPMRMLQGGVLVAARDFIFEIQRGEVHVIEAPPGSPVRRKLDRLKEQWRRHPLLERGRQRRMDRFNRGGGGFGPDDGGPDGGGPSFGGDQGGPQGPPPDGQQDPPPDGGQGGPPQQGGRGDGGRGQQPGPPRGNQDGNGQGRPPGPPPGR